MTRRPRKPDTRPPSRLRAVWRLWVDEHPELLQLLEAEREAVALARPYPPIGLIARVVEDFYYDGECSPGALAELRAAGWDLSGPLPFPESQDAHGLQASGGGLPAAADPERDRYRAENRARNAALGEPGALDPVGVSRVLGRYHVHEHQLLTLDAERRSGGAGRKPPRYRRGDTLPKSADRPDGATTGSDRTGDDT